MMLGIPEELAVSAIEEKYRQKDPRGTRPYAPKMMVVSAAVGIQRRDPVFTEAGEGDLRGHSVPRRAAGNHPDHTRISEFRCKHLDELEDLFLQVFQICQRMGLVELGNVAMGGTKVQASASKHEAKHRAMSITDRIRPALRSFHRKICPFVSLARP